MSDNVKSQTRDVSDFHSIALTGVGNIKFTQGDHFSFTLSADAHVHDAIETNVESGALHIGIKEDIHNLNSKEPINYHITAPELRAVQISGAGSFSVETLTGHTFSLETPGSSKVQIDKLNMTSVSINTRGSMKCKIKAIQADVLALDVAGSASLNIPKATLKNFSSAFKGSGKVILAGTADIVTVSATGTVQLDAGKLASNIATVESPGLGNITVWVTDKLTARISGMGTIRYYGNPEVSKHVTGMGKIKRLGDTPLQVV